MSFTLNFLQVSPMLLLIVPTLFKTSHGPLQIIPYHVLPDLVKVQYNAPRLSILHAPSLTNELLSAKKRFLFIVDDGGEDDGFPEVGLVGRKFAVVELEGKGRGRGHGVVLVTVAEGHGVG